jgi:hypothetical protein
MGLVEVVDVEDQPPLRGGEQAEVGHVRVAAGLHGQTAARGVGEIGGHGQRGSPEVRERQNGHPAVADRQQLRTRTVA